MTEVTVDMPGLVLVPHGRLGKGRGLRVADRDVSAITRAALPGRLAARPLLTLRSPFIREGGEAPSPVLPGLARATGVRGAEMTAAARV